VHDHTQLAAFDVHANQSHAAVLDRESGELTTKRLAGSPAKALEFLETLGPGVRAVYEAGPTGFGLARKTRECGLDLSVCSPGSIPRRDARIKTDRRDAERLMRLFAAGELTLCRVPTVDEERFRDLVRAREDIRPHAGPPPNVQVPFATRPSLHRSRPVPGRPSSTRRSRSSGPRVPSPRPSPAFAAFGASRRSLPAAFAAEVGDFQRFRHPRKLSGYLGLGPSEWTPDERRRLGRITKARPGHACWLLVEAAHHYRHPPTVRDGLKSPSGRPGSAGLRSRVASAETSLFPLPEAEREAKKESRGCDGRARSELGGGDSGLTTSATQDPGDVAGAAWQPPRPGASGTLRT
jgi:transposase